MDKPTLLKGHIYQHQGVVLAGVTSTLAAVDDGYRYVNDATMAYARDRGLAVHKACELHDKGTLDEDSVHPEILPYLQAYRRFLSDTGFKAQLIEERMMHKTLGYAGQIDRLGQFGFRRTLIDLKAVAQIQVATRLQLAAYGDLCRSNGITNIDERRALQLRPDGSYRLSEPYHGPEHLQAFVALLTVNNWRKKYAS